MTDPTTRSSAAKARGAGGTVHPMVGSWPGPWPTKRHTPPEELARLRTAVASGAYETPVEAVVDSIFDTMVGTSRARRARLR